MKKILITISAIVCFSTQVFALDNLFDWDEIARYPELKKWAESTGGKTKACSPSAWGYLSEFVEPNIENVIKNISDSPIDQEVKTILTEGKSNSCFTVALIRAFYVILGTDKNGATLEWDLSIPLLKNIYSGNQLSPDQDTLPMLEKSLLDGYPVIACAYGDINHTWLIIGMKNKKFIVYPDIEYDFYNGDFGRFSGIRKHMNFTYLREYDGSKAITQEEIYGGDSSGGCFINP